LTQWSIFGPSQWHCAVCALKIDGYYSLLYSVGSTSPVILTGTMSNPRFITALVVKNQNGGYYHPGTMYNLPKKMEVAEIYIHMYWTMFPVKPSRECVAAEAGVSPYYIERVIQEMLEIGEVLDPEILKENKDNAIGVGACLTTEEEIFLLSLRLEAPERPNLDYIRQL
jgi:hypothetical protein